MESGYQPGHMQVCTLLQTDNHTSTPPLFLQAGCPSCCPTNSIKALKAKANRYRDPFAVLIISPPVSSRQPSQLKCCLLEETGDYTLCKYLFNCGYILYLTKQLIAWRQREDMLPRQWQWWIYIRPWMGMQSTHLWWLAPWDRETNGSRYRLMPPYGGQHNKCCYVRVADNITMLTNLK